MTTATDALIRSQLADLGLRWADRISWNAPAAALYQEAVARGEGLVAEGGGLVVSTGQHTGRSPADKFVVRDSTTEHSIWWDNNRAMSREHFEALRQDFLAHARLKSLFVQDLAAGADPVHRLSVRVITEQAWHALFIQHLLILPADRVGFAPALTIINLPSFRADAARHGTRGETVIALDLARGLVLIGGTHYAGEMKKAVFTVLNYLLPAKGVLPMHCSANIGPLGESAVFFGLSGTGKTTLSADPSRTLLGDDEHGWSEDGLFNFEGGCYAKVIRLSKQAEPQIHAATHSWGTVLENVTIDGDTRRLDLDDGSITENTRAAYPLAAIASASTSGRAAIPRTIVMLTADAFGVLPPIARLTPAQAMYHFLSGYTAKVAGTERGVTEPSATFSTCFGAPFIPRDPAVYGNLLRSFINRHQVSCWLLNTGWTGGPHGVGQRMPIGVTRALLRAALDGELDHAPMRRDAHFGFAVPMRADGVDPTCLDPRQTWPDGLAYDAMARKLVGMFVRNFERFEQAADAEVRAAGPAVQIAAE
ncbi:phosphoenolpyruvate carboxykinase [Aestuariivirga sp.]|jgi:phosphoenolpyruvate carboxykinase (ATP)|uniref:phosphoenolpyruvate carboxykinase n=1 Tax=Aestuariivirga sp. TaxID=2650926 RepID=UPI003783FAC6